LIGQERLVHGVCLPHVELSFCLFLALLGLLEEVVKSSGTCLIKVFSEVDLNILDVLSDEKHVVSDLCILALAVVHHRDWCLLLDDFFFLFLLLLLQLFLDLLTTLHVHQLLVSLRQHLLVLAQDLEDRGLGELDIALLVDVSIRVLQHQLSDRHQIVGLLTKNSLVRHWCILTDLAHR
jgi:hypothetical protein